MRFTVLGPVALALLGVGVPTSALALDSADAVVVPTAAQVEAWCPDIGLQGLHMGKPKTAQDSAALDALRLPGEQFAPFDESELTFTAWSGLLAGVTWRRAASEGVSLVEWQDEVVSRLENAGWEVVAEPVTPAGWESQQLAKSFEIGGASRQLVVDVDVSGLYSIRCADAALLDRHEKESRGELAEGAPRPVQPEGSPQFDEIIARLDCDDESILAAISGAESLQAAGAMLERILGFPDDLNAEADFQTRLGTWLRWRMNASGRISEEELWALEDSVPVERPDPTADLTGFLNAATGVIAASEIPDAGAMCRGYRDLLVNGNRISEAEAERERMVNVALEAEARRRGIIVD